MDWQDGVRQWERGKAIFSALFVLALVLAACNGHGSYTPTTQTRVGSRFPQDQGTGGSDGSAAIDWCGVTNTPIPLGTSTPFPLPSDEIASRIIGRRPQAIGRVRPQGGVGAADTTTVTCVLDAGQETAIVVPAIVDPSDAVGADNGGQWGLDSCTNVSWVTPSPDGNVTFTVQDNTPGPSCLRIDGVGVTVTRVAGEPSSSPSPGQLIQQYTLQGSDQESQSESQVEDPVIYVEVYAPPVLQINDLDISGNQVVSSPNPSPSALMVGQQVQLQASPVGAALVSNTVTWNPESTDISNVVASYSTPCFCASPSPAASASPITSELASNPIVLYWLRKGSKHVYVVANVQMSDGSGDAISPPLTRRADVYYPIETVTVTAAKATTITSGTAVSYYWATSYEQASPCPTGSPSPLPSGYSGFFPAVHLGNECVPHGIDWQYSVTAPTPNAGQTPGAGKIFIVQLIDFSATYSNQYVSQPYNDSSPYIDGPDPYNGGLYASSPYAILSGGGTATLSGAFDAPNSELDGTSCTTVTRNDSFEDFFVYMPSPSPNRPSIPVTLRTLVWAWGGTATSPDSQTWTGSSFTNPAPSITPTDSPTLPAWPANNDLVLASISPDPCKTP